MKDKDLCEQEKGTQEENKSGMAPFPAKLYTTEAKASLAKALKELAEKDPEPGTLERLLNNDTAK